MRIERRITRDTPDNGKRERAERVARKLFPDADEISLTLYQGDYIAEIWNEGEKRARLYRLGDV